MSEKLSKAWPKVWPKFNALRMPFSFGSSVTTRSFTFTDLASMVSNSLKSGLPRSKLSSSAHVSVSDMRPCFIISPYPERRFLPSSVRRNSVSSNTNFDSLNTPTSFLKLSRFMPVFPPTEASTMARSVVGILMKSMPR